MIWTCTGSFIKLKSSLHTRQQMSPAYFVTLHARRFFCGSEPPQPDRLSLPSNRAMVDISQADSLGMHQHGWALDFSSMQAW